MYISPSVALELIVPSCVAPGNGVQMKIWTCYSGLAAQTWYYTDDKRIALYAGMVTSAFAFAEALSSSIWGRLSDKLGRKPILLCGLAGTGVSMLVFGFATNLPTVLIARALGGLLNGNIGVLQTTVAEVVTVEAHQAHAFAITPGSYSHTARADISATAFRT